MKVRFSLRAVQDLDEIAAYFDEIGPEVGDRIVDLIERRCASLAAHPRRGTRLGTETSRELRKLVSASYVIVYEVGPAAATIVRVLHGARNIEAALKDEGEF